MKRDEEITQLKETIGTLYKELAVEKKNTASALLLLHNLRKSSWYDEKEGKKLAERVFQLMV